MNLRYLRALAAAVAVALAAAACGGGNPPAPAQAPADATRVDPATAGAVTGKVSYDGPAPQNPTAKLDSDPACAREHPNGLVLDTILVSHGGLENVFVYVKDGLGNYYFDTPAETVALDQKGCRYTPRVFGLRTGQPVEISNSDPTMHTVHAQAKSNQEFNLSQPIQGIKNTKTFTAPEIMVHFKCNVHTWMDAYAGVLSHPYFAVTGSGGTFEIKNLPPGSYTVEAWHEKLGTLTQTVTIGDKETKTVDFQFAAR